MRRRIVLFAVLGLGIAAAMAVALHFAHPPQTQAQRLETQARRFVTLALSLKRIHPREIDDFFGAPELEAPGPAPSPQALLEKIAVLRADLRDIEPSPRRDRLLGRVEHLMALVGIIAVPGSLGFAEEGRKVYGIAPPGPAQTEAAKMGAIRAQLETLLPGPGSLVQRATAFRERFVVPQDRQQALFARALAECRDRTRHHWRMPPGESLETDWSAQVDAAWYSYQGEYHSQLRINPGAVAFIGSALDVACHEAYPGHHAQFVSLAMDAATFPVEETVVILRSPDQVLREGAANYGVDLAFPPSDRLVFMRDVLFPMAGFDPTEAARYVTVHRLVGELALSVMPILRDYRDRKLSAGAAGAALEKEALVSSPDALLRFTDELGAYTMGYTVARDLVRNCVEARARGAERWARLREIVARMDVSVLDARTCRR